MANAHSKHGFPVLRFFTPSSGTTSGLTEMAGKSKILSKKKTEHELELQRREEKRRWRETLRSWKWMNEIKDATLIHFPLSISLSKWNGNWNGNGAQIKAVHCHQGAAIVVDKHSTLLWNYGITGEISFHLDLVWWS
jgi:hypothetical protein